MPYFSMWKNFKVWTSFLRLGARFVSGAHVLLQSQLWPVGGGGGGGGGEGGEIHGACI